MAHHSDDVCVTGPREHLKKILEEIKGDKVKLDCTHRFIGPDASKGDLPESTLLKRIVRWTKDGIEWEASPKIAKNIIDKFEKPDKRVKLRSLKNTKPQVTLN